MSGPTGSDGTCLVVLRGNSGSGKTATARRLRERCGRGIAIVSQDVIRRDMLWEKDVSDGVNIGLIDTVARYSLDRGYHVIVEGVLDAGRYGDMFDRLQSDHRGRTSFWYWDLPFDETLRRHATKQESGEFGELEMRDWFRPRDVLSFVAETLIGPDTELDTTVECIISASGLAATPPALHASSSRLPGGESVDT